MGGNLWEWIPCEGALASKKYVMEGDPCDPSGDVP